MNHVSLMGRLTADPDLKYSSKNSSMAIARYTLAVDRRFAKKDDESKTTDFIRCVAFDKAAEFSSKYFKKGLRVLVEGRLQIGEFTNKDGQRVPTADIIITNQEFADAPAPKVTKEDEENSVADGFMNIDLNDPDDVPFS